MTRETKIGLLVGLAFIIVIGILLSDHMSASYESPQAALGGAGGNVRESVMSPAPSTPPVVMGSAATVDAPRALVPTRADLDRPVHPPVDVRIGPGAGAGAGAGAGPVALRDRTAPGASLPDPAQAGVPVQPASSTGLPGDLGDLARHHPNELAPVNEGGAAIPISAPHHYTAQPGDTVTRIAAHFYGSAGKSNRDLIVRANPSLQVAGNPVFAGRIYVIPNRGTIVPPVAPPAPVTASAAHSPAVSPRDAAGAVRWYTVKENDTLWGIAEQQLGSGAAWASIRDLNKATLKGSENLRANMRLRLPAKPIQSASAD